MKPEVVATTFGVQEERKGILCEHIKPDAIQRRFKRIARIYTGIYNERVWTEDPKGRILYDTDRGDCPCRSWL
jgi:hypothetical protein